MSTTISVPFEPLVDGFKEGSNEKGPWATVPYLVAWSDRFQFERDMRGLSSSTGISAPWTRRLPYQYPDNPQMFARDITLDGTGDIVQGNGPLPVWTHAIATVNFGVPDTTYDISQDPNFLASFSQDAAENAALQFATQEIDYGAEWINIPNAPAGFSDGTKIDTPMSRRITVVRMLITWHRFPVLPMGVFTDYADTVNNATFLGKDRGTVYFEGLKTVREAATDGTITQKVQMSLKWRKKDWNEFLRPDNNTFDAVIYNGDSSSSTYPYMNFTTMLNLFKA